MLLPMSRITPEQKEKFESDLISAFQACGSDTRLLRAFLRDLLTNAEYKEVLVRWQIIRKLIKKESHQAIAGDLHIGVGTVSRGAHELADREGGFWKVIKKLKL